MFFFTNVKTLFFMQTHARAEMQKQYLRQIFTFSLTSHNITSLHSIILCCSAQYITLLCENKNKENIKIKFTPKKPFLLNWNEMLLLISQLILCLFKKVIFFFNDV